MNPNAKRFLYAVAACLLTVATLAALAKFAATGPVEKAPELCLESAGCKMLLPGDKLDLAGHITLPWGSRPIRLITHPPPGIQELSAPEFRMIRIGWGHCKWRIKVSLQPYRPGEYGGFTRILEIKTKHNPRPIESIVRFPALSVKRAAVSDASQISIAEKIERKRAPSRITPTAALIAMMAFLILASAFLASRSRLKKKTGAPLPCYCLAMDALRELRVSCENGSLNPESCIERLSDIIRDCTASLFNIANAETMSCREFLEITSRGGRLSEEERILLADILRTADLVKFANSPADAELAMNAIAKAINFIKSLAEGGGARPKNGVISDEI